MDIGWNFRREHLRLQQRSHMIITNGGSQPNVVPGLASVWYYFRETDYRRIKELWDTGNTIAKAAAMMTGTEVSWRLLSNAWPQHLNKPVAETVYANIKRVGLPKWDEDDQTFAKMLQRMMKAPERGLATEVREMGEPTPPERNYGRRVGRHRRRFLDRADDYPSLPCQRSRDSRRTTGPAPSPKRRRSRTRAQPPARRSRR